MIDTTDPFPRRAFLVDLGRGAVAVAVLGVAACSPAASPSPSHGTGSVAGGGSPDASSTPDASGSPASPPPSSPAASGSGVVWERVNLGVVSAYVLARGGEAAIVDTGTEGHVDNIETGLGVLGLGWEAVGHVILTHLHRDHIGSLPEVMISAPDASAYAGSPDITSIASPRPLTEVADGDDVFGLRIIATPGHTPGSISVLDPIGGILVAGDALTTAAGQATGPNRQFSADMTTAEASVRALAALAFETLLVGHGDPITSGASASVAVLAASL